MPPTTVPKPALLPALNAAPGDELADDRADHGADDQPEQRRR